jgi:hypothetical protein
MRLSLERMGIIPSRESRTLEERGFLKRKEEKGENERHEQI